MEKIKYDIKINEDGKVEICMSKEDLRELFDLSFSEFEKNIIRMLGRVKTLYFTGK